MKIYLSTQDPKSPNYKWANSLPMLDGIVLDSEATEIICDNFVSSFDYSEVGALLSKIAKKMRIGCELVIMDVDVEMLCRSLYVEEIDQKTLNDIVFFSQKRKSLFSMSQIESSLPQNIRPTNKHYENGNCSFVLKCRREN
jgi:hypothetical protein